MTKKTISFVLVLAIVTLSFTPVAEAVSGRALRRGSRGSDVKELQKRLNELGYYTGNIDGSFGPATYNAVRAFQRANGLSVDGSVGKNTRNKLYSNPVSKRKSTSKPAPKPTSPVNKIPITQVLRRGSRGSQVSILQRRLRELGYYTGNIDGSFGPATYNAVRAFQRANSLSVDGSVGKNTRNKLYSTNSKPSDDYIPFEVKAGSLKGKTVIIDAGHGGSDSGAVGSGYKEKNFTLDMAKRLERMLKKAGAEVVMTRTSDVYKTLQYRANVGNIKVLDEEIKKVEKEIVKLQNNIKAANVKNDTLRTTQNSLIYTGEQIQENEVELAELEVELNEIDTKIKILEEKIQENDIKSEEVEKQEVVEETEGTEEVQEDKENLEKEEVKGTQELEQKELEALKVKAKKLEEKIYALTNENDKKIIEKEEIKLSMVQLNSKETELNNLENKEKKLKDELKELKSLRDNVSKYTGGNRLVPANKNLVKIFNRAKSYDDIIFISIHNNSTTANSQTSASGVRVYYRPTIVTDNKGQPGKVYYNGYNDDGRRLFAQMLNQEMQAKSSFSKKTSTLYGGSDFAVLREQNLVSALVEVGFMNNPNDIVRLKKQQTREDMAAGMFSGIGRYFATIK